MWVSFSCLVFFWLVFHHNRCVITANTLPLQTDVGSFNTSVLWNQWYWVKVNEGLEASLQLLLNKDCSVLWGRHVAWFHSPESAEMSPSALGFFMGKRMPYISPCTHLPAYTRLLLIHSFVPWFNEGLLSTYLSTEKKYVQPESWELSYSVDVLRTWAQDTASQRTLGNCSEEVKGAGAGRSQDIEEFLQQKPSSRNLKRLLLIKENQIA